MSFSGLKDIDREILRWIDDEELLKIRSINRKMWNEVCDDNFLQRRLNKYQNIEKCKKENESWKIFFSRAIHIIAKLKREFQFEYTEGDFQEYYSLLKNNPNIYRLLGEASVIGALPLVKHALQHGAKFDVLDLEYAAKNGHLHIVKYLTEQGANIHKWENITLRTASRSGNLNVIKYLVEQGADIHVLNDAPIREASRCGYYNIVQYLVQQGADIHADNNGALKAASSHGHLSVVKYLVQQGADIYFKNEVIILAEGYPRVVKYLKNWM